MSCIPLYTLRIGGVGLSERSYRQILVTHRATPIIRLLDSLRARGSAGSLMRSHSWDISAVSTDRLGSFLNVDFEPRVAASLCTVVRRDSSWCQSRKESPYHSRPKPLSLFANNSGVKNMLNHSEVQVEWLAMASQKNSKNGSKVRRQVFKSLQSQRMITKYVLPKCTQRKRGWKRRKRRVLRFRSHIRGAEKKLNGVSIPTFEPGSDALGSCK